MAESDPRLAPQLGNGVFDPASGFAGPEGITAPPEAALVTSIAQYVLED